MPKYYVNNEAQPNGDHELHVETCPYLPGNRKFVGEFTNCFEALKAARRIYIWANGCRWCSPPCHAR